MSRRRFLKLNFFLTLVIFTAIFLFAAVYMVSKYPWPVLHADLSVAKESSFLGHWPLPALDEERQERKKIRRYPKSEQQRRLGIIMRRMDYLNVPIFDFFMDQGVQYLTPELQVGAAPSMPLIWPTVASRRKIGTDDSSYRDIQYVVLPTTFGAKCIEGVQMTAGEEIRLAIPSVRNRRNIIFNILPLAPSNVRAWLGQNSWARQFSDSDVNQIHSFTIPVNDPVVTSMRLNVAAGNVLLASATVAQWERSGRLPVQVGSQSRFWKASNDEVEDGAEFQEEGAADDAAEEQASASTQSDQPPPAIKGKPGETNTSKDKKSKPLDELFDPESVKYNQVVSVDGSKSVALGYNAVLVQLDPILNEVFADETLFASLAPRLREFLADSQNLKIELPKGELGYELFQHTIVRRNAEIIPADLPILTKDLIAGAGVFNLYQEFRNFGYKVASFAPPKALSLPASLARGNEIPKLEGRWLDSNDWRFVARRRELDQQNEQVSGLEAIFKNERSASVQAMSESHFERLSEMLYGLETTSDAIPDWRANEMAVINDEGQYLPRLLDGFQRWLKDNYQSRFFAHIYLQNDNNDLRPTFKDFLKVLKVSKIKALALPSRTERLARIVMADRVLGQVIDALVARRIYHRTAVGIILPTSNGVAEKSGGRFLLHAPGLTARASDVRRQLKLDDVSASLAQIVGVQLNHSDPQGRRIFHGSGLENETRAVQPVNQGDPSQEKPEVEPTVAALTAPDVAEANNSISSQQVSKYRLIVLPRAAGCQPFEWMASSPYFGLTSSQPIVEEPLPRGRIIRVYPCGLRDQVIELSWFQSHSGDDSTVFLAEQVNQWLGGTFRVNVAQTSSEDDDSPLFLVGPKAMRFDALPLRLRKFGLNEVSNLFEMNTSVNADRETLARILNLSSQLRSDSLQARTVVYFFREPVLR